MRSLEADAELLGAQRIWAQTQPQGLTGNQENVMALLHKSGLSPPGGGERMEGRMQYSAVISAEIFSCECLSICMPKDGIWSFSLMNDWSSEAHEGKKQKMHM